MKSDGKKGRYDRVIKMFRWVTPLLSMTSSIFKEAKADTYQHIETTGIPLQSGGDCAITTLYFDKEGVPNTNELLSAANECFGDFATAEELIKDAEERTVSRDDYLHRFAHSDNRKFNTDHDHIHVKGKESELRCFVDELKDRGNILPHPTKDINKQITKACRSNKKGSFDGCSSNGPSL